LTGSGGIAKERQTDVTEQTQPAPAALRYITVASVVVVGLIAAIVSYSHMVNLGLSPQVGEGWRSWLIPISIDGLIVAASMVLVTRRRAGLPASHLAWGALGVGVTASIGANMADASGSVTSILYAGWAPVALAVGFELLLIQRRAAVAPTAVVEAPTAAGDTPAASPIGWSPKISGGQPALEHLEVKREPVIEAPRVQRPLVPKAPIPTKTPLRLVSEPAGRSPVRDTAVRWLTAQHRKGVNLDTITPAQLATGARLKIDTCRRNLDKWRRDVRSEVAI
jgi:hypothetical protein